MDDLLERLRAALADRYTIERELGRGGMATVYLARDLKHERLVAVKVLRPELAAALGAERFLREIKITANLNHPHVLPLLDSGSVEEQPSTLPPDRPTAFLYYVMPYVEGESLRDRLNRDKQLPIADALKIASEVADALGSAHRHNCVHRDIKPENVLLQEGHAVVADFGVARAIEQAEETRLTETGISIGTPAYLSPEQAAGERDLDGRSDIYALGCVLYEMLAGQPPFTGPTIESIVRQHLAAEPQSVTMVRPTVPSEVDAAVSKALAKAPADRFQTAEELVAALSVTSGTSSGGVTLPGTTPRWSHPVAMAGLFGVGALVVLGLVYVLMIQLGLPDWVMIAAGVSLVVILPFAIGTGLVEKQRATRTAPTPSSGMGRVVHRWLRWRKATQGSLILFAGLGVVTTGYMGMRSLGIGPMGTVMAKGMLEEHDRILVVDFENRTSDSTLGATLTDALRIDLGQSPVIRVLESQALRGALQRMGRDATEPITLELAEELAEREGVKAIIAGEVGALGDGYVLSGRLVAPATGEVLIAERVTASGDQELIQAVDDLSARMRERIGESLRTVRGTRPLAQVTTSSLDALRLYTQGDRESWADAIPYYEQAIALDSTFAMAYRQLRRCLVNLQIDPARQIELSRQAYAHRDRLSDRERLIVEEAYYATVEGDREKAKATYRRILERYPDDPVALTNLGLMLQTERKWAEAVLLFARRRALAENVGESSPAHYNIVWPQFVLNDTAALDSSLQMLEVHSPYAALGYRSWLSADDRDYNEASAGFEQMTRMDPEVADAWNGLQRIASVRGQLALATEMSQRVSAICQRRSDHYCLIRKAYESARLEAVYSGSTRDAVRRLDSAVNSHLDSVPNGRRHQVLQDAATWYAILGQDSAAAEYLAIYQREIPEEVRRIAGGRDRTLGWVELASGQYEEAIVAFREWGSSWSPVRGLYELAFTFDRMGNLDSALALYERAVTVRSWDRLDWEWDWLPNVYRRLGELYEQRGDSENAVHWYNEFVELWKDADPELLPQVEDVMGRIARLTGEPQR